jgi:uncharacterized membrane protein YgaE (UPF0421/DUF939 family)
MRTHLPERVSRQAVSKAAGYAWPLLQATAAATAAWIIARHLIHGHAPFFAPIAAVIALNASRGQRGLNGLRLVLGVFVGIAVGELSVAVLGSGYPSLAVATFTALAIARVLARATLVLNQASVAAILTVVSAGGQAGPQRLADALIGTGVALVCTQLLFSPEPVGLLRRAQESALRDLAAALERTASSLDHDGTDLADDVVIEVPSAVVDLRRARHTIVRAVRHSAVWRRRLRAVAEEQERAAAIELLAASWSMLCRITLTVRSPQRDQLARPMHRFSRAVAELSNAQSDPAAPQRAADEALSAAHEFARAADPTDQTSAAATTAAHIFAIDLLAVVGINVDEAASALRSGDGRVIVPIRASTAKPSITHQDPPPFMIQ